MDRLANMQIPDFSEEYLTFSGQNSSTVGEAFKALKHDSMIKAEAAQKYCSGLRKDILVPLNTNLLEQKNHLKEIGKIARSNEKKFEDKKTQVEEERGRYCKLIKDLDDCIESYEAQREKKDFNEEKKTKLTLKINQMLKDCKESEKLYKGSVYAAKEARSDYIKGMVLSVIVHLL